MSDDPVPHPSDTPEAAPPAADAPAPAADLIVEDDAEFRAAKALHARIQGARRRASLVSLVTGLVLGVALALVLQPFLADQLGNRFGTIAMVVVFFAPLLGALTLAQLIADATVRAKVGAWIDAIAKEHGVAPSVLEDHARIAGIER